MSKLYYSSLYAITKQIITSAEKLRNKGKLIEASNMIQKAEIMFDPELCLNPKNKTLHNLKAEYVKHHNMIVREMIKEMT